MALTNFSKKDFPFKSLVDGVTDLWLASTGDPNAYYYNGMDLPIRPLNIQENGADMAYGTLGSLAVGEWAWGDVDSLGYNLPYVRLSDDTDPDTKASGYLKGSEPIQIFQAQSAVETIVLSMLFGNNDPAFATDAKVIINITDNNDNGLVAFPFDVKGSEGIVTFNEKIVLKTNEKFKILTDKELLSVLISMDVS
jgi:hypothetical protein